MNFLLLIGCITARTPRLDDHGYGYGVAKDICNGVGSQSQKGWRDLHLLQGCNDLLDCPQGSSHSGGYSPPEGIQVDLPDAGQQEIVLGCRVPALKVPENTQITLEGCD
jgi:hypothetical protein